MSNVNLTAQLSGPNEITISGFYGRSVVINEKVVEMIERVQNESKEILSYLTEALDLFITSKGKDSDCTDLFVRGCNLVVATKSFIEDIKRKSRSNEEEEKSSMEGGAL